MNLIRKINSIKNFVASCTLWNVGGSKRTEQSPLYFMDGLIAVNSSESMLIGVNQQDFYAFNIGKYEALREKYGLKDQDIFIGRDSNYILFRDGNLLIESKEITINCTKIILNGVEITVSGNKISVGGKEIAVVGGDINAVTNKIETSGQ